MADVVEYGGNDHPPPRRRPGAGTLVGVAALVILLGAGTYSVVRPDPRPAARPSPSPTPSPSPSETEPSPEPADPEEPALPARLAGRPLRARTGLHVVLAGDGRYRYDVDGRSSTPLSPRGEGDHQGPGSDTVLRVRDGVAVSRSFAGVFPPASHDAWYLSDRGAATRLGRAADVAAARTADAVWLVSYDQDHTFVERHGLAGQRTSSRLTLPTGYHVFGETAAGLVAQPMFPDSAPPPAYLVDIRSGRRRELPMFTVAGVTERWIVGFGDDCGYGCTELVRYDVTTRSARTTQFVGTVIQSHAMSPDARTLALLGRDPQTDVLELRVVDAVTGLMNQPGVAIPDSPDHVMSWSAGGRWLVFTVLTTRGTSLALWRPGSDQLEIAATGLPRVSSFAAY